MPHAIEPPSLVPTTSAIRALGLLVVQSFKLQGRLALAIGALTASECVFLLCLLVFPFELLLVAGLRSFCRLGASPSHRLAEWGIYFLEQAPRMIEGCPRTFSARRDGAPR